jgi:hypothetical protein
MTVQDWFDPLSLRISELAQEMPAGFFTSMRDQVDFWLVSAEVGVTAIMLPNHHSHEFDIWTLDKPTRGWDGIHLGAVELLLDRSSIGARNRFPGFGELELLPSGEIALHGKLYDGNFARPESIVVGRLGGGSGRESLVCSHWALTQCTKAGELRILFERTESAAQSPR